MATPSLKKRLAQPGPAIIAGAHSALSAKLVEEAGFDGVWASGFEISAARAVPDANILTMAENVEAARQMAEAVNIPVVNVIRTVREYEKAGIAGICMEDNIFPKRCSFYAGVKRELATPEEHAGKIRASLDVRRSEDFLIIARTEALIAGWGLEEALKRARLYADAGADLVLIHSKSKTPDEITAFAKAWDRDTPMMAVPTIYKETTADELNELGYRVIVMANHAIRSSIKAMQTTLKALKEGRKPAAADPYVVPLDEVYRLVGVEEMQSQEKSYLPAGTQDVRAVILAAGGGEKLLPLTENTPTCMLDVKGKSILERQVEALNTLGIKDIAVVRGYKKDAIKLPNIRYFDNDAYASTGELASLLCAREFLQGRTVVLYGDILFEPHVLESLLQSAAPVTLAVDRSWADHQGSAPMPSRPDLVKLKNPSARGSRQLNLDGPTGITQVARGISPKDADAEFIGMLMLSPEGAQNVLALWDRLSEKGGKFHEAGSVKEAALTDLLSELIAGGEEVVGSEIYKGWMEVDSFEDYRRVWADLRK